MSSSSTRLYFYTYYKISEWQSCSLDQCRLKFSVKCSRLSRCQSLISHICIFCIMNSDKMVWKHSFVFCKKNAMVLSLISITSPGLVQSCTHFSSVQTAHFHLSGNDKTQLSFFFVNYCLKWWFFPPWRLNWKWNDNSHAKSLLNRLRLANLRPLI